jgi:hypothetical protein
MITKESVAQKSLVDGSEISLHTHAEGVGCISGHITTDGSGNGSVTLNTPLASIDYAISLTAEDVDTVSCMWSSKTVNGFAVRTEDDKGISEPNCNVDWIVNPYNNP